MLAEKRTAGTQKCGLSHVQQKKTLQTHLRVSLITLQWRPAGTGRPVPKNLQDDPFAAEKYWQDWESGLNGKVHHDRPPSDWDGWDAPGAGDGTPPTDYIRSR